MLGLQELVNHSQNRYGQGKVLMVSWYGYEPHDMDPRAKLIFGRAQSYFVKITNDCSIRTNFLDFKFGFVETDQIVSFLSLLSLIYFFKSHIVLKFWILVFKVWTVSYSCCFCGLHVVVFEAGNPLDTKQHQRGHYGAKMGVCYVSDVSLYLAVFG